MIETEIDTLLRRLARKNLLTPTINLYAESVKGKFRQVRWSIDLLHKIEQQPNIQGDTSSDDPWQRMSIDDKVLFFCECFWDFLRSSIDIASQLINELYSLNIDETKVSFDRVFDELEIHASTTPLFKALVSCKCSWAFKELNSYRHCSTHRRQVCIFYDEEVTQRRSTVTRGYDYDGGGTKTIIVNRYLCSNPWSLHPRKSQKRPVLNYNEKILGAIEKRLSTIVKRLP